MIIDEIGLKDYSYKIHIFKDKFNANFKKTVSSFNLPPVALVVTNPVVKKLYINVLKKSLESCGKKVEVVCVPDSERAKSITWFEKVIKEAVEIDKFGNVFFVAFGGGVIGDLVGFASSVYKRGTPYIQVPTTFLSYIDSALGGKTAIDFPFAKNIVGSFWHPLAVIEYMGFLESISAHLLEDSMSEVIKYGVIKDKDLFYEVKEKKDSIYRKDPRILQEIIKRCVHIKCEVVSRDEKEKILLRTILNFGHTIGHALEGAGRFQRYTHGKAVATGMVCASLIGYYMGLCKYSVVREVQDTLKLYNLPCRINKKIPLNFIMKALSKDKKFKHGAVRMVLPLRIGKVKVVDNISATLIKKAIQKIRI